MDLEEGAKSLGDFAPDLPRPAVACTLVKVVGSAPQEVGARMWVTPDRFLGTLGGGEFERQILQEARRLLAEGSRTPLLKEYVLCRQMGQCCGGRAEVFFEPVGRRKAVHLFGAGHVGRAVAQVLSQTPFDVTLVDQRPEWINKPGLPADVRARHDHPLEYCRARVWGPDDGVCVFTHSHDLDFALIRHLLAQPVGFLGLIGSKHKAEVFAARLKEQGELFEEKVRCPVGYPLDSKSPKVIAVSIAAQLLQEWGLKAAPANVPLKGQYLQR